MPNSYFCKKRSIFRS